MSSRFCKYETCNLEICFIFCQQILDQFLRIIGGIMGVVYNYLLEKTLRLYALINQKGPISKILLPFVFSIFTSCCNFGVPWLVKCKPCLPAKMISEECPSINSIGNFNHSAIQQVNTMIWQVSFSQQMLVPLKISSALAQEMSFINHHSCFILQLFSYCDNKCYNIWWKAHHGPNDMVLGFSCCHRFHCKFPFQRRQNVLT